MTRSARRVLEDCREALQLLEDETDTRRWRIMWVAAVALTRSVGHVLKHVDGKDPVVGAAVDSAYRRWKETEDGEIFREFIERDRNLILKEYDFSCDLSDEVMVMVGAEPFSLDENLFRPMTGGFRDGEDARDVLTEALDWWEKELAAIDAAVGR